MNEFLKTLQKTVAVKYLSLMMFKDTKKTKKEKLAVNDMFLAFLNETYKSYDNHYKQTNPQFNDISPKYRSLVQLLEFNDVFKPTAKTLEFWQFVIPIWWNDANPFKHLIKE